jgi:hypothetical protein
MYPGNAMHNLICFLERWQDLAGALLGGLVGLVAAYVVAWDVAGREKRRAALLLIADLMPYKATATNLKALATEQQVPESDYPIWVSEKLHWRRPHLSPLFDSYFAYVLEVDAALAAHLTMFRVIQSSMEDHLQRIEQDAEDIRHVGDSRAAPRHPEHTRVDAAAVADSLALLGAHAECAIHLCSVFALSRTPTFLTRLRMRVKPNATEQLSRNLLENGHI